FLAGDVNRPVAGAAKARRNLDEQRRFSNSRIAAEEEHRSADETAAGDAIEFGNSGSEAGRLGGVAGERFEREDAPLGSRNAMRSSAGGSGALLYDRIPFSARGAVALPAAEDCAAVLAD